MRSHSRCYKDKKIFAFSRGSTLLQKARCKNLSFFTSHKPENILLNFVQTTIHRYTYGFEVNYGFTLGKAKDITLVA